MSSRVAYSYVRFSTPEQEKGDSLRRQAAAAERWIAANPGYVLDDKLSMHDTGVSAYRGKNLDKGSLGAFLRALEAGDIPEGSVLLVERCDRISREPPWRAATNLMSIIEAGCDVVNLSNGVRYDASLQGAGMEGLGRLIAMLVEFGTANDESHKKSVRLKEVFGQKPQRRTLPWWLKDDNGVIVEHPTYADVVRQVYEQYLAGSGTRQITQRLTDGNVAPPKAQKWHASLIVRLLASESVTGVFQPHRDVRTATGLRRREPVGAPVPGHYPRVISDEVFAQAAAIRETRQVKAGVRVGAREAVTHILANLARCPVCDAAMKRENKGKNNHGRATPPQYVCSHALSGKSGACQRVRVDVATVEKALVAAADTLGSGAPSTDPNVTWTIAELETRHTLAVEKAAALAAKVSEWLDTDMSKLSDVIMNKLHTLEAERDALAAELEALRVKATAVQPNTLKLRLGNMVGALKAYGPKDDPLCLDAAGVNAALFACFAKVTVDYRTGELVLYWRHDGPTRLRYA